MMTGSKSTRKFNSRVGQPEFLSIRDVQRRLSIGRSKIYNMIDDGRLKRVRIDGKALVTTQSIDEYVAKIS